MSIGATVSNKNELYASVAQLIDKQIHSGYTIFNVNKIAYDILDGKGCFEKEYTLIEKLDFERYLEKQIQKISLKNRDDDFIKRKMLEMYANPLINQLEAIK